MTKNEDGARKTCEPARAGYRNPPAEHRFKKGQSGNPGGRPRKQMILKTLVGNELNRKIPIVQNGQRQLISCLEAIVKRSVQDALTGNPLERRLAIKFLTANLPAAAKESVPQLIAVKFIKGDEEL